TSSKGPDGATCRETAGAQASPILRMDVAHEPKEQHSRKVRNIRRRAEHSGLRLCVGEMRGGGVQAGGIKRGQHTLYCRVALEDGWTTFRDGSTGGFVVLKASARSTAAPSNGSQRRDNDCG